MATILEFLRVLTSQTKAIISLYKSEKPVFLTWPVERFSQIFHEIYSAYVMEFKVKKKSIENIALCEKEEKFLLFIGSWMYQVYVNERTNLLLESLLVETGHRNPG